MRLGTGPGHGIDHPDLQQASLFVRAGCATASGRCTQALGEGGARSNPVKFFLSFFLSLVWGPDTPYIYETRRDGRCLSRAPSAHVLQGER